MGDAVLERIAAFPWTRGGVVVRKAAHGYSLFAARSGAPVARLRLTGTGDAVQVL